jgi:hypothetical protein
LVQFDPVPGFDAEIKTGKKSKYMEITLPYIVESTVIYSLNIGAIMNPILSNTKLGIAGMFPQIVTNADR